MKDWLRRHRLARVCVKFLVPATLLMLVACGTTSTGAIDPANGEDWPCLAFRPITWSRKDSDKTIRQVREHNAVWEALCGKER
jgi:hypothetical protein